MLQSLPSHTGAGADLTSRSEGQLPRRLHCPGSTTVMKLVTRFRSLPLRADDVQRGVGGAQRG